MQQVRTIIDQNGGIIVPLKYQKMLGLKPGDEIVIKMFPGELKVIPLKKHIQHAQKLVRQYVPDGKSLVDELIKDRRKDANHE